MSTTHPSNHPCLQICMDWFAKLLCLPRCFLSTEGPGGGVIQSTASEAVLVAMLAARWVQRRGAAGRVGARVFASGVGYALLVLFLGAGAT